MRGFGLETEAHLRKGREWLDAAEDALRRIETRPTCTSQYEALVQVTEMLGMAKGHFASTDSEEDYMDVLRVETQLSRLGQGFIQKCTRGDAPVIQYRATRRRRGR